MFYSIFLSFVCHFYSSFLRKRFEFVKHAIAYKELHVLINLVGLAPCKVLLKMTFHQAEAGKCFLVAHFPPQMRA